MQAFLPVSELLLPQETVEELVLWLLAVLVVLPMVLVILSLVLAATQMEQTTKTAELDLKEALAVLVSVPAVAAAAADWLPVAVVEHLPSHPQASVEPVVAVVVL